MAPERYRISDLVVDVEGASVERPDAPVALPKLSFDLLVTLARRAPAVVPAAELISTVWPGLAVTDEVLTQRVALLRKALGDEAKDPRYVRAVRGRGYQLVPAAVALGAEAPARETIAPSANPNGRWGRRATLAALAFSGLVLAGWAIWGRGITRAGAPHPTVATQAPSAAELVARAGTYLARHQDSDNELAIDLYERALELEPANARAIAGLSLGLSQRWSKFNRRGGSGDEALELARRAVALDPSLGLAHHALAMALDSRGAITPALASYRRAAELEPDPRAARSSAAYLMQVQGHLADALESELAVATVPGEGPVYLEVQLGVVLGRLGYDEAAAVWLERANELRPDNVFAPGAFAELRLSEGRIREADEIAAAALARGIRRPELPIVRGTVALMGGDEQKARSFYEEALRIDPTSSHARARILLLDRRQPGADVDALGRRYRDALEAVRQERASGDEWPEGSIETMLLAAGFGDHETALAALDEAISRGFRDAGSVELDPMLAGLRGDPGWSTRMQRLRDLVAAERRRVATARWLPPGLLSGGAIASR